MVVFPVALFWTRSMRLAGEIAVIAILASFGGSLALAITVGCAREYQRRLDYLDVIRMTCWVLVGSGIASSFGYNPFSLLMIMGGLLTVGFTWVVFPTPFVPQEGCCLECGYDLRGLSERRCPECGTQFDQDK